MDPQSKANNDNKANQCNPNNAEYKGHQSGYGGDGTQADRDNHANQLNPNNSRRMPSMRYNELAKEFPAICLPLQDKEFPLSASPYDTTSKLAGLFSTLYLDGYFQLSASPKGTQNIRDPSEREITGLLFH